jgi:hypothetical protein
MICSGRDDRVEGLDIPTQAETGLEWGGRPMLPAGCIGPSSGRERPPQDDNSGLGGSLARALVPSLRDLVLILGAYPGLTSGAIACRPFGLEWGGPLMGRDPKSPLLAKDARNGAPGSHDQPQGQKRRTGVSVLHGCEGLEMTRREGWRQEFVLLRVSVPPW